MRIQKRHDNAVARQIIEKQRARLEKRESEKNLGAFDSALGEGMLLFTKITRPTKQQQQAYRVQRRAKLRAQQVDPKNVGKIARARADLKNEKLAQAAEQERLAQTATKNHQFMTIVTCVLSVALFAL
ncbi:MAG: hypothetical protein S4CHLAM123_13010 [Chlamydiales bacterium]|nr:hypothetical protein [Chlamydiales bacterium]